MNDMELLRALRTVAVETGNLACLGCGYRHNCSTHGCAILQESANRIATLQAENKEAVNLIDLIDGQRTYAAEKGISPEAYMGWINQAIMEWRGEKEG